MIQLRDYQRESIDSLYRWFEKNQTGNPLLVLPTGAGKSVIAAALMREILSQWADQRIILITHVKELIEQNYLKLMDLWSDAPAGIYSASFNRRDTDSKILFCGIQSVHNKAMHIGWADILIVDEAHLIPKNTLTGMYRKFLDAMTKINPAIRIVGLTATPFRLDSGLLTEGENALFDDIAYEVPITLLLERGYLAPLTTSPVKARAQLQGVGKRGGEFIFSDLAKAVDHDDLTQQAVAEIVSFGSDRKSWLVFCTGVAHANNVLAAIEQHGINAAIVTGNTPKAERSTTLARFKRGEIRALVNVDVLTTGFDAPNIDLMAYLRPTQSAALYIQMAGRGMRTSPSKSNCLVLDFAGNIARHGPIDCVTVPHVAKGEGGQAPQKECPVCNAVMHTTATECPDCGYVFPTRDAHEAEASTAAIMSSELEPESHPVSTVLYSRHSKEGKPDSLRVDYYSGFRRIASEWVCVEHGGRAGTNARVWLASRISPELITQINYPPRKVDEVLDYADQLTKPSAVLCKKAGKFTEIVGYEFEQEANHASGNAR